MRQALVALLLSATLLAGCAGEPSEAPALEEDPEAFDDVQVTETTGAIRGIVFDEAITPLEGVLVTIAGGANRTTDEQGAFVFSQLEPGDYFVQASKLGYTSLQRAVTVVAGVEDPEITKIQLSADIANQPYTEFLQWTGYLGCGAGTNLAGSVNPCAADALACDFVNVCLLNTANTHFFDFGTPGKIPVFAQAELVWEGTQALGDGLNLGWHRSGTSDFKGRSGPSPVVLPTNATEIVEAHPDENLTGLLVRVFPGSGTELTVTLQQRFDVYVTYFYGFSPKEGWAFVNDGACIVPDDCA